MQTNLRALSGNWNAGYALDKHTVRSFFTGYNEFGRPMYDTLRTEVGEALFLLKYRNDYTQAAPLAQEIADTIVSRFPRIGLIVPVPPSNVRARQPVNEIGRELGRIIGVNMFEDIVRKAPPPAGAVPSKNLTTRAEKDAALEGRLALNDEIQSDGRWNALLLDDMYHTGASLEAVCAVLRTYSKISGVYVATASWR